MAELIDESSSIESTTVGVYRTSSTVKGGRRFSFSALVVVGDRNGKVGVEAVVFDRNGYRFHGRVKALADAAREGGLKF